MATFSDSWHRVAALRVTLRPQVQVHRQAVRGERWFVLHDPVANAFFRVRRSSWAVLGRFDGERTIGDLWREAIERDPEEAPGQQELVQLLAQLHAAGLLIADVPEDTRRVFERQRKRSRRELTGRLLGIMFARFPLVNPDPWLKRALPLVGWVFSKFGFALWLVLLALGAYHLIDQWPALADQSQGVLAPGNLPLLYLSLVGLALLHESGHAFACRRYGGQVPTLGVMLLIFTPLPYVDVTSSWSFRQRRHRLLVGAAGMMTELAVAAVAAVLWARTGPGLVNSLAFNVMFLASVSTLLFNLNPLLRFDGYYLLCDAAGLPNLQPRAQRQLRYLWEKHVLGLPRPDAPAQDRQEAVLLTAYGIAAAIYRVFLCAGIILFVAGRFLLVGLVMAVFCLVVWGLLPTAKGIHYLVTSPALDRRRERAWTGAAAAIGLPLLLLGLVPVPRGLVVAGVVEAEPHSLVVAEAAGVVVEVLAPEGARVEAGQPLLRLENAELLAERAAAVARRAEAAARLRAALRADASRMDAARRHLEAVEKQAAYVEQQVAALVVRARHAGEWVAPGLAQRPGMLVPRGAVLGEVLGEGGARFVAVVPAGRGEVLFDASAPLRAARLRLRGQLETTLLLPPPKISPGERLLLPSPALGWRAGGPVAVRDNDPEGMMARDPFFVVTVELPPDGGLVPYHGQTGRLRLVRPPAPLLVQGWEALRRLLQRRFRL